MANPRKFSEKIALHNQKQAEETAAFEAIMREVSCALQPKTYPKQQQHLHISQNLGAYRGGSLPNVNQIASNSGIDLQNALHNLEDMKQGRQALVDRLHQRQRMMPHRRPFNPMDKRQDCSPYPAYLSPPPDTSWRRMLRHLNGSALPRTNSDSALHTSTINPAHELVQNPVAQAAHRRDVGDNSLPVNAIDMKGYWDREKLAQSRPKSCEVPNINIYPSPQEQDASGTHIPISNNTGSLPDLTVLQFQPPLPTPLDVDDTPYSSASPTNLSPTSPHHMNMPPPSSPQSPIQKRRPTHGTPSPLVLSNSPGGTPPPSRIPLSPPVPNVDPSKLTVDPRIRQQYKLYIQQQQQRHRGPTPHHMQQRHSNHQIPNSPAAGQHPQQVPQVQITPECEQNGQASMTTYRNNVSEGGCQSPTSPLSAPSYSPTQSPGLPPSQGSNSPFAEVYYSQQQTNALQHQFEQFNMLPENCPVSTVESSLSSSLSNGLVFNTSQPSLNFSQASMQGLTGSQELIQSNHFFQQQQQQQNQSDYSSHILNQHHSPNQQQISPQANSKIPDIVLTGADENFGHTTDFAMAKDLSSAISAMNDGLDSDFFPSDEALKVGLDPLDLEGLQILTDPNIITDPATEDSFRLDRMSSS